MNRRVTLLTRAIAAALLAALVVPSHSAPNAAPAAAAADQGPINSMLDPTGTVLVDGSAFHWNMQGFDQEKVLTHGRYQYTIYWDASTNLTLARRDLDNNAVQTLTFPDRLSADDPHRNTALGVSTKDGRLHLVYDHHNNPINYRVSRAGYLTAPPRQLSLADFSAERPILDPAEQRATYPRFFNDRDGDLYFIYRHGVSGNGNSILGRYDAAAGSWHRVGLLFSRQGVYPPWNDSPTRNAYLSGILFDDNDRLHVSWLYREADAATRSNHDVHYAYSDDYGRTWRNNRGTRIANLPAGDPIAINDPGIVVVSVPGNTGLRGQSGIAIDSRNQPHVLSIQSTVTTGNLADLNQHYIHHWRHPDGSWHSSYIDDTALPYDDRLRRGNIFLDKHDNVHVYIPYRGTLWAAWATAPSGWADWTLYAVPTDHPVADFPAGDGIGFDRGRLERDGILTIPVEVEGGASTGFALLDFNVQPTIIGEPERPPAAPALSITGDLGSSEPGLKLRWTTVVAADDGYNVYRRDVDGGTTERIASRVAADALNDGYLDTDIEIGATYAYHVRAVNRYGESQPSNTVYASIRGRDTADWTDYRVEFDFGEISATTLAVTFRRQDPCHLYSWQIRNFTSHWAIRPIRIDDCNQRPLRDDVPLPFSLAGPDMHRMAVQLQGGGITTYVDGRLSFALQDSTYLAGPMGLRTSNTGGPAFVDSIRITDPGGNVLFQEDFSTTDHSFVPDGSECAAEVVEGRLRIPAGSRCMLTALYAVIGDSPPATQ